MDFERLLRSTSLTQTERAAASYVAANPRAVLGMSTRDLAAASFTSPATVVRVARKLGFPSFGALKIGLARATATDDEAPRSADFPELLRASHDQVAGTISSLERRAVRQTELMLKAVDLAPIVDAPDRASGVSVYGLGYSALAGRVFASNLRRVGKNATCVADRYDMALWATVCARTELSVFISYSGQPRVAQLARLVAGRGMDSLALTADPESELAGAVTWSVPLAMNERPSLNNRMAPFSSLSETLYVLDVLYASLFSRNYVENVQRLTGSLTQQGAQALRDEGGAITGFDYSGAPGDGS